MTMMARMRIRGMRRERERGWGRSAAVVRGEVEAEDGEVGRTGDSVVGVVECMGSGVLAVVTEGWVETVRRVVGYGVGEVREGVRVLVA